MFYVISAVIGFVLGVIFSDKTKAFLAKIPLINKILRFGR